MDEHSITEAPRPNPGYQIYVKRAGRRYDVTDAVMDAFDMVINSLDFGSGFLSKEEMQNLGKLARAMGVDPEKYGLP